VAPTRDAQHRAVRNTRPDEEKEREQRRKPAPNRHADAVAPAHARINPARPRSPPRRPPPRRSSVSPHRPGRGGRRNPPGTAAPKPRVRNGPTARTGIRERLALRGSSAASPREPTRCHDPGATHWCPRPALAVLAGNPRRPNTIPHTAANRWPPQRIGERTRGDRPGGPFDSSRMGTEDTATRTERHPAEPRRIRLRRADGRPLVRREHRRRGALRLAAPSASPPRDRNACGSRSAGRRDLHRPERSSRPASRRGRPP
jgi:hypothetical protein